MEVARFLQYALPHVKKSKRTHDMMAVIHWVTRLSLLGLIVKRLLFSYLPCLTRFTHM